MATSTVIMIICQLSFVHDRLVSVKSSLFLEESAKLPDSATPALISNLVHFRYNIC